MIFLVLGLFMLFVFSICFYVSKKLFSGISYFFKGLSFWWVFAVFTIISTASFFASFLRFSFLQLFFSIWFGGFVYIFLFTVISDVVAFIFKITKSKLSSHKLFPVVRSASIIFLTLLTVIYGVANARSIKVTSYEIELESETQGEINIAMISDLHLGAVGSESRLSGIVDKINALKPDAVCIAGDFFDTDFGAIKNPEKAIKELRRLEVPLGVYACLGNHDAGKTFGEMRAFLEECNVTLLCDEYTVIDGKIALVGRLDRHSIGGFQGMERGDSNILFEKIPSDLPVVVMDHNPSNIGEYFSENLLILSGHTHKGQLFPASIITSLMFEEDYGYYKKDASSPHVIVSSGIGYWGMPMRVGTKSEIANIKLTLS